MKPCKEIWDTYSIMNYSIIKDILNQIRSFFSQLWTFEFAILFLSYLLPWKQSKKAWRTIFSRMDKSFDLWKYCKIGTVICQDIKKMLEKQKYEISVLYEKTELETKFLFKYLG